LGSLRSHFGAHFWITSPSLRGSLPGVVAWLLRGSLRGHFAAISGVTFSQFSRCCLSLKSLRSHFGGHFAATSGVTSQPLCSHFAVALGVSFSQLQSLLPVTRVTSEPLRGLLQVSLRSHFAANLQPLRCHFTVTLQPLCSHFAAISGVTLQPLRGSLRSHFAATLQSLRGSLPGVTSGGHFRGSLCSHFGSHFGSHFAVTSQPLRGSL
jgi:hypothetical protein